MIVQIYWNLHKLCWPVRDKATSKVVKHADMLTLTDAKFKVSEAGRQRVIKTRHKNVHAVVEGTLSTERPDSDTGHLNKIRYNPYKQETFTCDGNPIFNANIVHFLPDRQVLAV